jgi:ligand-binding sensor domain-containing protein/signal transduction histidine kinase
MEFQVLKHYPGLCSLVVFMLLNIAHTGYAGNVAKPEMQFEQIPYRMTTNTVTAIAEDPYGFIWVGTNSGLNRFDGVGFRHYHSSDEPNTLSDNVIGSMYIDSNGVLWVSGRSSISRYRRETDDFVRYELTDPVGDGTFRRVRTITEDRRGIMWAAGGRHSLYYFDRTQDRFVPYEPLVTRDITTIHICDNDFIWATTERNGLQRININTGEITLFKHDPGDPHTISSDQTTAVVRDRNGTLWVGSQFGGVNRLVMDSAGEVTFVRYDNQPGRPKVLENNYVYTMYVDREGRLWLGNDNGGLHLYDYDHDLFHHYSSDPDTPYSLSHPSVSKIFQDSSGRLWVGTALAGLNVSDRYAFKFRHHHTLSRFSHRLSSNIIRDFEEDRYGNIWIATDGGGLNYYDRSNGHFRAWRHDPHDPGSIHSDAVISTTRDHEGQLWTGTYNGGVQLLADEQKGIFVSLEERYGLPSTLFENPFDLHFDREHPYLWVAELRRGVFRFHLETGAYEQFNPVPGDTTSLASNFVLHVFEDSHNNLWFASLNGLSKLTPESKHTGIFRRYWPDERDPSSIPGSTIRQITEDGLGRLWIATEGGLAMYQHETDDFFVFDETHGLPHRELRSIAADENHNLWIGSVEGLSWFQPETSQFHNFREQDGLQGHEFTPYAGHRLSTGEMVFGGMNGFNLFHPDSIRTNPHVPPVYITGFKLFNKSVTVEQPDSPLDKHIMVTEEVSLAHWQNVITIDFIALNFTNAEQNLYAYMMEGFDSDWIQAGTSRSATYTNLNPGTYHFRVKASNNDGVWNEDGAMLTIVIVPPFWQNAWFYILMAVFGLLILYGGFRYRVKAIRSRNRQLLEMVSQRTQELEERNRQLKQEIEEKQRVYSVLAHDLRNPFMSIIGFSEYLSEKLSDSEDQENREISRMVLESSKNLFQLLENLLEWASAKRRHLKPRQERINLYTMISKALKTNQLPAQSKGVRLQNRCPQDAYALGDKNMIQTVLRNLISNAIKFSKEDSEVTVTVQDEHDGYMVSVSDTGIGMSKEEQDKVLSASGGFRRTGTKGEKGIGFGLMLSQDFIHENGGRFQVQSEKDKGSTFSFTLKKAS